MTTIIVFASIALWLVLAGISKPAIQKRLSDHCVFDRHRGGINSEHQTVYRDCFDHHHGEACLYALAAPVIAPFALGSKIGSASARQPRAERVRLKQLADAEHRKKLAELSLETTKIKEKEAGV